MKIVTNELISSIYNISITHILTKTFISPKMEYLKYKLKEQVLSMFISLIVFYVWFDWEKGQPQEAYDHNVEQLYISFNQVFTF